MHAKIIFTSDFEDESLIIILKGNQWWPTFDQESSDAENIITEMKASVKESDIQLFIASKKFVLLSAVTETRGTLSFENKAWVLRLLNPNLSLLQLDCQVFVHKCMKHAGQMQKKITFYETPVQLVERNRKDPIIEGKILASIIDDPFLVTEKQMESWIKGFNSWDVTDAATTILFDQTPFAWKKAKEWTKKEPE